MVLDTSSSTKKSGGKRAKRKAGIGVGTTESDEEEDKLIEEVQTEEGKASFTHINN